MANRLSHSACSRYLKCGESYRLHYIKKLRPKYTSSALLFGSALDAAVGVLLENPEKPYMDEFWKNWEYGWINKKKVHIPMSTQVVYAASDFDKHLINDKLKEKMFEALQELGLEHLGEPLEAYSQVETFKKQAGHRHFKEEEFKYLNYCNWLCLSVKAELLIEAFKKDILPKLSNIKAVQKKISLEDGDDEVVGYIDFIADWEGVTRVFDLKTSARAYDEDAVSHSAQLALYGHHEGIDDAGFIVLKKQIKKDKTRICKICGHKEENNRVKTCSNKVSGKRCGGEFNNSIDLKGDIQVVLGKINTRMEEMVISNLDAVNNLVHSGVFLKNTDSCTNWYGQKCPYYNLCHHGKENELEDQS